MSIKLFLPARLKLALHDLANAAKQALSDYLRAVLARHLLGERLFREWQAALAKANADKEGASALEANMSRDKAIKAVQRLIRLYLSKHGYHVEQAGQQWQWRRDGAAVTPADDELMTIPAAAEALIRSSAGTAAA